MLSLAWIAPAAALTLMQPLPSQIRVKIFPHLYDYAPQGLDVDPSTVTLTSASSCEIDQGDSAAPISNGTVVQQVDSLNVTLTSADLDSPLWYKCDGEIQVIRAGEAHSYSYDGPIYAHNSTTGPELVEVTSVNDYIRGVIPSEMDTNWAKEALRAQAVAARTYAQFHIAFAKLHASSHVFFDVDDTVFYQAYTGTSDRKPSTDHAIQDTNLEILTYNDQVIQAYFSASAGGYTEEPDHVWPVNAPYCVAKPETFSDADPWTTTIALSELNQKLFAEHLISSSNPVVDAMVKDTNRWPSGRAKSLTLVMHDGVTADVDALVFRKYFELRSTLFTLQHVGNNLVLTGRGFGHGVGMSQDGAQVLATKQSWTYQQILNFYYTGIKIQ